MPWNPPAPPATTGHEEDWQVHESYLDALFRAAVLPGGPLVGIASVEKMSPPERDVYPALGFVYKHTDRDDAQSPMGQEAHINYFELSITVAGGFDPQRTDTARAAFEAVENFVNDRQGNGVLPLLRLDSTLGETADYCHIQNGTVEVGLTPSGVNTATYLAVILTHGKVYV